MGEIRITLQPGDSLIVDCNCRSEEPAGPDGHPDEEQNGETLATLSGLEMNLASQSPKSMFGERERALGIGSL